MTLPSCNLINTHCRYTQRRNWPWMPGKFPFCIDNECLRKNLFSVILSIYKEVTRGIFNIQKRHLWWWSILLGWIPDFSAWRVILHILRCPQNTWTVKNIFHLLEPKSFPNSIVAPFNLRLCEMVITNFLWPKIYYSESSYKSVWMFFIDKCSSRTFQQTFVLNTL